MVFIRLRMYFIWILRYFLDSESIWKKSKFIKGPKDFRSKMLKRCFFLNKCQSWYFDCQIVILKCVHLNSINSYWPWKNAFFIYFSRSQYVLDQLIAVYQFKNLIHFWKNKYLAIFLYQKEKNNFFFLSLKNLKGKKKQNTTDKTKIVA